MDKWEKLQNAVNDLKTNLDVYVEDAKKNGAEEIESNDWLAQLDDIFKAAYGADNEDITLCME
jgi:hypothetical protein